ncbi:hypothetical protein L4D77_22670 [Photobacterium frigidiphilum]|uniref:hypothetical protein n=1 Tax=Photobacterium frigidiphilum TaxID=264736 RepID=UPI003D0D01C3
MKVHAYAIDSTTNNYQTSPNGRPLRIHADDAATLKSDYPHEHNRRTYKSTHSNVDKRQRLKLVTKNQTNYFSYIGEYDGTDGEHDDESISHSAAIEALSRLTRMVFFDAKSELQIDPFTFTEVLVESSLELANGKTYFPDLLCHFNEEHPLYDRWGGKLAIEVTYSHACEEAKKHDFEFHNIPIFEVVIKKGSSREYPGERYNWDQFSYSSIEKHTNNLESWFSKSIGINLLVDPISTRVHKQIADDLTEQNRTLETENIKLSAALSNLTQRNSTLEAHNIKLVGDHKDELQGQRDKLRQQNKIANDKIDKLKTGKSNEKSEREQAEKHLHKRATQVTRLSVISVTLFLLVIGALLAPMLFTESSIQVLNWYFHIVN